MKQIITIFSFLFLTSSVFSQINKGQWLAGGSFGFSFTQSGSSNSSNLDNELTLSASPNIGYFLVDGLAIGIRGQFIKDIYQQPVYGFNFDITQYAGSIFIRYYFLPRNSPVNILVDGGGGLGNANQNFTNLSTTITSTQNVQNLFISVGPEIFLNPNTGLELLFSYRRLSNVGNTLTQSGMFFGIGFQIHLGKGSISDEVKNKQMKPKHN